MPPQSQSTSPALAGPDACATVGSAMSLSSAESPILVTSSSAGPATYDTDNPPPPPPRPGVPAVPAAQLAAPITPTYVTQRGTAERQYEVYVRQQWAERQRKFAEDVNEAARHMLPPGETYHPIEVQVVWRPLPSSSAAVPPDSPTLAAGVAPQRAAPSDVASPEPSGSGAVQLIPPALASTTVPKVALPLEDLDVGFEFDPTWELSAADQRMWYKTRNVRKEFAAQKDPVGPFIGSVSHRAASYRGMILKGTEESAQSKVDVKAAIREWLEMPRDKPNASLASRSRAKAKEPSTSTS